MRVRVIFRVRVRGDHVVGALSPGHERDPLVCGGLICGRLRAGSRWHASYFEPTDKWALQYLESEVGFSQDIMEKRHWWFGQWYGKALSRQKLWEFRESVSRAGVGWSYVPARKHGTLVTGRVNQCTKLRPLEIMSCGRSPEL